MQIARSSSLLSTPEVALCGDSIAVRWRRRMPGRLRTASRRDLLRGPSGRDGRAVLLLQVREVRLRVDRRATLLDEPLPPEESINIIRLQVASGADRAASDARS